ncbi:MAG: hypothetical protein QXR87_04715 [Candidatus Hadarchaeales archaeon]
MAGIEVIVPAYATSRPPAEWSAWARRKEWKRVETWFLPAKLAVLFRNTSICRFRKLSLTNPVSVRGGGSTVMLISAFASPFGGLAEFNAGGGDRIKF